VALTESLAGHAPADRQEARDLRRILGFVARHADPFDRRIAEGHLTGSALLVSADGERTLLLFHHKLSRWLQPGGHADAGDDSGEAVALREAGEETGISGLCLHPRAPRPLDVDIHAIPARENEPAHEHLDLRYLVVAPYDAVPAPGAGESRLLRWFAWEELAELQLDAGLRRALGKARTLMQRRVGT
jgi:8-oxo-dGTP pyrophosphatase MutT (NUDIX family)